MTNYSQALTILILSFIFQSNVFSQTVVEKAANNLEFRIAEDEPADGLTETIVSDSGIKVYLNKDVALTNKDVHKAYVKENDYKQIVVIMKFTDDGAKKMKLLTEKNIGKRLAILVNGKVIKAPKIHAAITDSAEISGLGSIEEMKQLVKQINGE